MKKLIAGFGGAIALNILHEVIRKNFDNVPHINEVGEEALRKGLDKASIPQPDEDTGYLATLAGDILSNGVYYAVTATNHTGLSGLLAGAGAVYLPKQMGLNEAPVASTDKKKLMTVGYYLFGAIVTRYIYNKLKK